MLGKMAVYIFVEHYLYCYLMVFLLKQNIYSMPCIPLCDTTGLYVPHISSLAEAQFPLTLSIMAAQYWILLDDSD